MYFRKKSNLMKSSFHILIKERRFLLFQGKREGLPLPNAAFPMDRFVFLTGVERLGKAVYKVFNMARPSSVDILNLKDSIKETSFIWTDGLSSYNALVEEKNCSHKAVRSKNEYDKVNHLNNVNRFHQKMESQYQRYKGVSSKYINRYAALFNMQRECRDMDVMESLLYSKKKLKKIKVYYYIRQITYIGIFEGKSASYA